MNVSLEEQIRECFGRAVYTHKTHEKMADQFAAKLTRYKVSQIVLTALTSSGAVGILVIEAVWVEYFTVAISFLTLFVSAYLKNFDLGGMAQKHRDAASKIWNIRECYLSLLTDIANLTDADACTRRDELQKALAAIYLSAPRTNGKAYKSAQDGLKYNEELTFTAEEIDCFLPLSLKRAKGNVEI